MGGRIVPHGGENCEILGAMSTPQPTAQGTLAQSPLSHVMLSVAAKSMSGTLAIWPDPGTNQQGQDRILFNRGQIVAVLLMDRASSDVARSLLPLFRRQQAPYAFYPVNLVTGASGMLQGTVDVYWLFAASLRGGSRSDMVERILQGHGADMLRLTRGAPVDRFGFIPKENAFLDLLRAEPQTVEQLISRAGDEKLARRMIYLLSVTGCISHYVREVSSSGIAIPPEDGLSSPSGRITGHGIALPTRGSRPGSPPSVSGEQRLSGEFEVDDDEMKRRPEHLRSDSIPPLPLELEAPELPPRAPAGFSPELTERWNDVREMVRKMDTMNHFQLLGIQTNAKDDDVRKAYFEMVKSWHPDRLPPELEELREYSDGIFKALTDAQTALLDHDRRGPYLKLVQSGEGTPKSEREAQAVLTAAMEFQKVEVLIGRKKWDEAKRYLNSIIMLDPDNPEYLAARAEILWSLEGDKRSKEILDLVNMAIKNSPRSIRALSTKARIMEKQKKPQAALKLYKQILEVQPRNVEAGRMVRLLAMRAKGGGAESKGKGKGKEESGGLFGFFKKK